MANLELYKSIDEKNEFFRMSQLVPNNKINDIDTFNAWYHRYEKKVRSKLKPGQKNNETFFFRGVSEAKYKLYNSAQRIWITKDIGNWDKKIVYQEFLKKFINSAKTDNLFKR